MLVGIFGATICQTILFDSISLWAVSSCFFFLLPHFRLVLFRLNRFRFFTEWTCWVNRFSHLIFHFQLFSFHNFSFSLSHSLCFINCCGRTLKSSQYQKPFPQLFWFQIKRVVQRKNHVYIFFCFLYDGKTSEGKKRNYATKEMQTIHKKMETRKYTKIVPVFFVFFFISFSVLCIHPFIKFF